jgi:hypothetical protein
MSRLFWHLLKIPLPSTLLKNNLSRDQNSWQPSEFYKIKWATSTQNLKHNKMIKKKRKKMANSNHRLLQEALIPLSLWSSLISSTKISRRTINHQTNKVKFYRNLLTKV